jgi:lycopene beta-cyclase
MNPSDKYDLIILGGGCAGLSLAMQLARYGSKCPQVLILEQRTQYTNDRTWCFWDDGTASFGRLASHFWRKMIVRARQETLDLDCRSFSYCMLSADEFYRTALEAIAQTKEINLILERKTLGKPTFHDGLWKIETDKETFTGKIVIDTRPHIQTIRDNALLWQSFLGHEITCDEAVFDPTRVVLMDFVAPNPSDIRFTYVLPMSPYRALVEATVFGVQPLMADDLTCDIDSAIRKYTQQYDYKISRSEHAVLPMGVKQHKEPAETNYVRVGLMAGGARNSSGYAFQRIQAWAQLCADSIIQNGTAISHSKDYFVQSFMDQLFLHVLKADPEQGPVLLLSLFKNTSTECIIRFLSDRASVIDCARVALALPMAPFIKQLWLTVSHRLLPDVSHS